MTPPAPTASARTRFPMLRAWWLADRAGVFRVVGLAVALISFVFLWPSLIEAGGAAPVLRNMVVHLYVVAWMMLATIGVRSIGSREVLTAYLLGTFMVPLLVFVPLAPVINWLGTGSDALGIWWVPPVEETALLAGVALIAWRLCRKSGRRPGVLDLVIVGFSVGSGLAIHEDGLYGRFLANFYEGTLAGAFDGVYGWLFPTFPSEVITGGVGGGIYHSGKGALYGLAIGLFILLRRRWPLSIWIIPAMWAYGTFDHVMYNQQVFHGPSPLRFLTGNGHAVSVLLMLTVPVMLVIQHWLRTRVDVGLPAFGIRGIREAIRRGSGPVDTVARLLAYGQYHRARNAAITATWSNPEAPPPRIRGVEAWGRLAFARRRTREAATSSSG